MDGQLAREYYHGLLDRAMSATRQGEYFLPVFVDLILRELRESNASRGDGGTIRRPPADPSPVKEDDGIHANPPSV